MNPTWLAVQAKSAYIPAGETSDAMAGDRAAVLQALSLRSVTSSIDSMRISSTAQAFAAALRQSNLIASPGAIEEGGNRTAVLSHSISVLRKAWHNVRSYGNSTQHAMCRRYEGSLVQDSLRSDVVAPGLVQGLSGKNLQSVVAVGLSASQAVDNVNAKAFEVVVDPAMTAMDSARSAALALVRSAPGLVRPLLNELDAVLVAADGGCAVVEERLTLVIRIANSTLLEATGDLRDWMQETVDDVGDNVIQKAEQAAKWLSRLIREWFAKFEDMIAGAIAEVGDQAESFLTRIERFAQRMVQKIADVAYDIVDAFLTWVEEKIGDTLDTLYEWADGLRSLHKVIKDSGAVGKAMEQVSAQADNLMAMIDGLRDTAQELRDSAAEMVDFDKVIDLLRSQLEKLQDTAVTGLNEKKAQALSGVQKALDIAKDIVEGLNDRVSRDIDDLYNRAQGEIILQMERANVAARSVRVEIHSIQSQIADIRSVMDNTGGLVAQFESTVNASTDAVQSRSVLKSIISLTPSDLGAAANGLGTRGAAEFSSAVRSADDFLGSLQSSCGDLRSIANVAFTPYDKAISASSASPGAALPSLDGISQQELPSFDQMINDMASGNCLAGSDCQQALRMYQTLAARLASSAGTMKAKRADAEASLWMLASPNLLPSLRLGLSLDLSGNATAGGLGLPVDMSLVDNTAISLLTELENGLPLARQFVMETAWTVGNVTDSLGLSELKPVIKSMKRFSTRSMTILGTMGTAISNAVLPPIDKVSAELVKVEGVWAKQHKEALSVFPKFVAAVNEQKAKLMGFRGVLQNVLRFVPSIDTFLEPLASVERAAQKFQDISFSQHAKEVHSFFDTILSRATATADMIVQIDTDLGGLARKLVTGWNVGRDDAELVHWSKLPHCSESMRIR